LPRELTREIGLLPHELTHDMLMLTHESFVPRVGAGPIIAGRRRRGLRHFDDGCRTGAPNDINNNNSYRAESP